MEESGCDDGGQPMSASGRSILEEPLTQLPFDNLDNNDLPLLSARMLEETALLVEGHYRLKKIQEANKSLLSTFPVAVRPDDDRVGALIDNAVEAISLANRLHRVECMRLDWMIRHKDWLNARREVRGLIAAEVEAVLADAPQEDSDEC